jgi:hypothetical protein
MNMQEVTAVLTELSIRFIPDTLNPNHTVHLIDSHAMVDATELDGPWNVITLDRKFSTRFNTPQELAFNLGAML